MFAYTNNRGRGHINRVLRSILLVVAISGFTLGTGESARADAAKDFVTSCSYGVLAGTLVGAATLAFTDKPGDNLNKIARGASIGLYLGILLGLYVTNLSDPSEEELRAVGHNRFLITPILESSPAFRSPDSGEFTAAKITGARLDVLALRF